MKIAWVTTPADHDSVVGQYSRSLLPELVARAEVVPVLPTGHATAPVAGIDPIELRRLEPREFDHVVYAVGNEAGHAFMLPVIKLLGGTIDLHAWNLTRLARAAFPALVSGGLVGSYVAAREGGLAQARSFGREGVECPGLTLHRSVTRHGDAFLVHDPAYEKRLLDDRNQRTPIATISLEQPWAELASKTLAALEQFPPPRAARKKLVAVALRLK